MSKKFLIAPIGKRFSAQFIDEILAFGVAYSVMLGVTDALPQNGGLLIFLLIFFVYSLFADGLFEGQSIGKKIMGLYVVHNKTEMPCGFGRSFLRNIAYIGGIVDLLFLILRKDRRRLGDLIAGTKVVVSVPAA